MKQLAFTTSRSIPVRPVKNRFSTPIYPCFRDGSIKPYQGTSRRIKANQAYFPARLPHPSLRPTSLCHPPHFASFLCSLCYLLFKSGPIGALFSRAISASKKSPFHQKIRTDSDPTSFSFDPFAVISRYLRLIPVLFGKEGAAGRSGFWLGILFD